MANNSTLRLFLPCLLIAFIASACSRVDAPTATPAATPTQQDLDLKPILRQFLSSLPQDWNLVTSQNVATTKAFIVDVRQPEEYSQGFIEGAVNIPLRELAQNLQALPAMDKEITLVCNSGHRSAIGMAVLQMLGYSKAKSLDGGLRAWQSAKLPVVTAPVPKRPTNAAPKVNSQLQAMLDYYLVHTLPVDWGAMDQAALTEDQLRKSSSEIEAQPETFDQGRSLLVDVDGPDDFAQAHLDKAINAPLRALPDSLDNIPLQETINWA